MTRELPCPSCGQLVMCRVSADKELSDFPNSLKRIRKFNSKQQTISNIQNRKKRDRFSTCPSKYKKNFKRTGCPLRGSMGY